MCVCVANSSAFCYFVPASSSAAPNIRSFGEQDRRRHIPKGKKNRLPVGLEHAAPLPAPSQALPRELRRITAYWKPPGGLSPAGRCERLFHLSSWLLCLFSSFVKERQRKITETGTQRKPCKLLLVCVVQVSDNEVGSFCDRRLLFQGRPSQEGFIQWHEKLTKKTQRKYSNKT